MGSRMMTAFVSCAAAVGLAVGTATPAFAGDQDMVDKAIGFLQIVQDQASVESCPMLSGQLAQKGFHGGTEADLNNFLNSQVAKRRQFISARAGGLTPAQSAQVDAQINKSIGVVRSRALQCGIAKKGAPAAPAAPAPKMNKVPMPAKFMTIVIANPFDPAHPWRLPIPTFVPESVLAQLAHMLPAGSSLA